MPITAFQKKVLKLIESNRSPDSYVAGVTAIQRAPDSLSFQMTSIFSTMPIRL